MSIFRSFSNVPILNQPEAPPTPEEMAADLAEETCLRFKALQAEVRALEEACEYSPDRTPEAQECMNTLEALMKGRHRWVVVPVVLEHLPELITPPNAKPSQVNLEP